MMHDQLDVDFCIGPADINPPRRFEACCGSVPIPGHQGRWSVAGKGRVIRRAEDDLYTPT